ncbi:hypothetical protein I3I95_01530 [bacterium]|nr:hypothetical protein [bacterium]
MTVRTLTSGRLMDTRIFTAKNLLTILLVSSVLFFTFYMRLNISSEFAYINVLFYLAIIGLTISLRGRLSVLGMGAWAVVGVMFLVTEINANTGLRDIVKFFFLYCAPLLVCQLRYGGRYDGGECARAIVRCVNFFVLISFGILILDLLTGSAVMTFLTSRFMPEMAEWVLPGAFERHASIWGHYLITAGFYMVFLFMNVAYAKVEGEYLLDVRLLYVVATVGILSTGGKTALVIYLVSIVWLNITGEHRVRNAIALTVFLLALYLLGVFDIVLMRFGAEDLSSGRNDATTMMLSRELPRLFTGYGENFTSHAASLIGSFNTSLFSEYSLLALCYKFGLAYVALACLLVLRPFFSAARRTGKWNIVLMGIASLAYFSTFNGLMTLPDTWNMLALFAIMANLLESETSKNCLSSKTKSPRTFRGKLA